MCCSKVRLLLVLACLTWLQAGLAEETAARIWLLSLGSQVDDDGSAGYGLGVDWGVSETTWLSFYGGISRSPAELADVTTRTLVLGLDQRVGRFGFTVGLESWGEPDELESRDLTGSVYLQGEGYRLALKGERRDIDITFNITAPEGDRLRRTTGLTADGIGAQASFDVAERWRFSLDGMGYDYSRDLTVLPRLQVFDFLASSALTLANSFIDVEWGAGLEYDLGGKAFGLQWRENRSAVDGSELRSLSGSMLLPAGDRWDLELALGISDSQELPTAVFGGVYLFFYGGG